MSSQQITFQRRGRRVPGARRPLAGLALALLLTFASISAFAQKEERSGKAVVDETSPAAMRPAKRVRRKSATGPPGKNVRPEGSRV